MQWLYLCTTLHHVTFTFSLLLSFCAPFSELVQDQLDWRENWRKIRDLLWIQLVADKRLHDIEP